MAPEIYVASSWRNEKQAEVVAALRAAGLETYDFKHPYGGYHGFHWSEIDATWQSWDARRFVEGLEHPIARAGFATDMAALNSASLCVLVMPCGRSAHLEAGWAAGHGKHLGILLDGGEPELMYSMADKLTSDLDEMVTWALSKLANLARRAEVSTV